MNSDAWTRARAATQRGYKKQWSYNIPGSLRLSSYNMETTSIFRDGYTMLRWDGPEDQYLIMKLTETTGLLRSQIDFNETDKKWISIVKLSEDIELRIKENRYSNYRDRNSQKYFADLRICRRNLFDAYRKLFEK
jgi:hypothetical protein